MTHIADGTLLDIDGLGTPDLDTPDLDMLEALMDRAWPGLDNADLDGWRLRSAAGVTQRANSVWPRRAMADPGGFDGCGFDAGGFDAAAALRAAEAWYAQRSQPAVFQLTDRQENAPLETLLDAAGYVSRSKTLIMVGPVKPDPAVGGIRTEARQTPSDEWVDTWWSVDGRGAEAEKAVARDILASTPSVYVLARAADGAPSGTGRLTVADGWGGIYSVATRPDHRRQGVATDVMAELVRQAAARGASRLWLLVTAANVGAQELYRAMGFTVAGSYHYRVAPPA